MDRNIIQRAFELARSGNCRSLRDIQQKLKAERYEAVEAHLSGSTIRKQLLAVLKVLD